MFVQNKVSVLNVIFVISFLGLCRCASAWDYPGVGCKLCTTRTWIQTATASDRRSENRRAVLTNVTTTVSATTLKYWEPDGNFTTPGSQRRIPGTQMGDLDDHLAKSDISDRNRNEKEEKETKKKKLKKKAKSDYSNEKEVAETGKIKLKPRSHASAERDVWSDSSLEPKHDFWEASDFDAKSRESKMKKGTSGFEKESPVKNATKKKKYRQEKYSSIEKNTKAKPGKYSSTEKNNKVNKGKYFNTEKNTKVKQGRNTKAGLGEDSSLKRAEKRTRRIKHNNEKWSKRKPLSKSGFENKKFGQDSREMKDFKQFTTKTNEAKVVFGGAKQEFFEDFGKYKHTDSETSIEKKGKPTRMADQSRENKNSLGAGDSTEERGVKFGASDLSDEFKYRRPRSSSSSEETTTTAKTKTRSKPRNLGREKYLYKVKKALRSTMMPQHEEDPKNDNSENMGPTGNTTRDIMDQFIDPFLNPYACKTDMEQAAMKTDGVDSVVVEVVGRTAEYNNIVMLKLSGPKENTMRFRADAREDKYLDEPPEKKIVFIVHGLTVYGMLEVECLSKMRVFKTLLSYYAKHLDKFDIYLIPLANPDGFSYAERMRLWCKNRSPQALCPGVQVDRNFEVAWKSNSAMNSCDQHFPGPTPFSEAESRAIRDVFHKHGQRMIGFINVHSSSESPDIFKGDAVLYPKGYTDSNEDTDRYLDLQGEIEEMMNNASFRHLSVQVTTLKDWYGIVRGTSVDYASSVYGIPYALEFSMQPYPNRGVFKDYYPDYSTLALEQIWRRVIDVIFNNMNSNHQDRVGFRL